MNLARFITFEGGEGSGKSTQISKLVEYMKANDLPVVQTREPGGTQLGDEVRRILLQIDGAPTSPEAELYLFLASRVQHVREIIQPTIAQGSWVVSDRYHDSTIAYQGYARNLLEGMEHIVDSAYRQMNTHPGLTFFLDINPKKGLERVAQRAGENTRFDDEELAFHYRLREGFLNLANKEPHRIQVIDAAQPLEEVTQNVLKVFEEYRTSNNF